MILRRAIVVAALVGLVSTAAFSEDCVMGRYTPDQKGYTPEHLQLPIAMNWEYTATKFDGNPTSPLVSDGKCFFASGDRVYAVDLASGKYLWRYPADRPLSGTVKATPAISGGRLYFGGSDGIMYCLEADTGAFVWAYKTRGVIRCAPVISEGTVYFASDDNSVYAVNAESGEAVWNKPCTLRDDISSGICVGLGVVIAACVDGNLYAVNTSSGTLKWGVKLAGLPTHTSPVISESIALMTLGDNIYGFTARSGQLRWVLTLPADIVANPATDGTTIYVPCRNQKMYAYTLTSRQPVLKWTAPADFGAVPSSSPVVADDTVFLAGQKGMVGAFSASDGSLKWRYMFAPAQGSGLRYTDAASCPTVADGTLTVLTDDGVLHCFAAGAPDCEKPAVYNRVPANASSISNVPPFKISAVLYDVGSGVDFSSVSLTLDGVSVDYTPDYTNCSISAIYGLSTDGSPVRPLAPGVHKLAITGRDYAGNSLNEEWFFYGDPSLPAPKQPVKPTTTQPNTRGRSGGTTPGGPSGRGNYGSGYDRGGRGDRSGYPGGGTPPAPPMPPGFTPGGGGAPVPSAPPTVLID